MQAWIWRDGGPYFGIPVQNFAGWVLTTFSVYLVYRLYERRVELKPLAGVEPRPLAGITLEVAALPVVAYAAMAVSDVLAGDPALLVITPFTMGLPVLVAGGRLWDSRLDSTQSRSDSRFAAGEQSLLE